MPAVPGLLRRWAGLVSVRAAVPPLPNPARWPHWVAVFLTFGLVVRVRHFAQSHSYWYDEAYLLLNIFRRPFADLIGPIDYTQVAPPAYLWLERAAFLLLGPAEWAMRLPAFVAGLLALGLMAALARRAVGGWAAWLPVAFLALSRNALNHACEVKPYSTDLLTATAALLTATVLVREGTSRRGRKIAAAVLLALAAVGPWLSFTAVFPLGGAVVAVFVWALRSGNRRAWALGLAAGAILAASLGAVWYFDARHLYYQGVGTDWQADRLGGFPNWSSVRSLVFWPLRCGINVGNYGTREMGAVLLVLGAFGVRRLVRVNPALAAAVVATPILALTASYLGKYPLVERTALFLLPGLWLAAAAGIAELAERFFKWRWPLVLPFVVLLPDLVFTGMNVVVPPQYPAARKGYEYVRANRHDGDLVWASHAEVYYAYHGPDGRVCGATTFPHEVLGRASGRVWIVDQPNGAVSMSAPVVALLREAGYVEVERRALPGVVVVLYARPPDSFSPLPAGERGRG